MPWNLPLLNAPATEEDLSLARSLYDWSEGDSKMWVSSVFRNDDSLEVFVMTTLRGRDAVSPFTRIVPLGPDGHVQHVESASIFYFADWDPVARWNQYSLDRYRELGVATAVRCDPPHGGLIPYVDLGFTWREGKYPKDELMHAIEVAEYNTNSAGAAALAPLRQRIKRKEKVSAPEIARLMTDGEFPNNIGRSVLLSFLAFDFEMERLV